MMPRRGQHGFTLLELLVAVALMGILAVLCWRGLDTVLRSRDVITQSSDELRALTTAFAQMEDDLQRSWAVRLLGVPGRDVIIFTRGSADGPVALDLLRESGNLDERLRLQQVIYRLRDGQLERGFGPWVPPNAAFEGQLTIAPMVWQPLLNNVAVIEMRAFTEKQKNWVDAASLVGSQSTGAAELAAVQAATPVAPQGGAAAAGAGAAAAGTAAAAAAATAAASGANPIVGLEFVLARRNGGRILRQFTIRD